MYGSWNARDVGSRRRSDSMIEKLKSEIFDIIRDQDVLKMKFAELERFKKEKLEELEEYEKKI
jgi:hypothetical protein